jgi:hypothetical protein
MHNREKTWKIVVDILVEVLDGKGLGFPDRWSLPGDM